MMTRRLLLGCLTAILCCGVAPLASGDDPVPLADNELVLVVMDPLSAPLACDCVQGYAQRKYEHLGEYLTAALKRPVRVVWGGAIDVASKDSGGKAHLVIGKHSVVTSDAAKLKLKLTPIAALSGMDGVTTQTGIIVVRKDDPAQQVSDLQGYRIFFGPEECDEKSAAPIKLLKKHGVEVPAAAELETCGACSEAAVKLMELDASERAAAVISSYAQPLLEGCGNIQKGDLRIVGISEPVPFITAFANAELDQSLIVEMRKALLAVHRDPELCRALETIAGFVSIEESTTTSDVQTAKKK